MKSASSIRDGFPAPRASSSAAPPLGVGALRRALGVITLTGSLLACGEVDLTFTPAADAGAPDGDGADACDDGACDPFDGASDDGGFDADDGASLGDAGDEAGFDAAAEGPSDGSFLEGG